MNCERCGQRVNEMPACEHRFVGQAADGTLRCTYCGHNFGPVRELIEAKEKARVCLMNFDMVYFNNSDLRAQVATLTRERDEIREYASISDRQFSDMKFLFEQAKRDLEDERKTTRARIAELEQKVRELSESRRQVREALDNPPTTWNETLIEIRHLRDVVHANGTWEWKKP
jgi:chromosome segregation ATPase/DNA-directed RNA polymerase subunit RPC12/RpoP